MFSPRQRQIYLTCAPDARAISYKSHINLNNAICVSGGGVVWKKMPQEYAFRARYLQPKTNTLATLIRAIAGQIQITWPLIRIDDIAPTSMLASVRFENLELILSKWIARTEIDHPTIPRREVQRDVVELFTEIKQLQSALTAARATSLLQLVSLYCKRNNTPVNQ